MTSDIRVKICGLRTPETVAAAVEGGAAYVGFVFFPPSPRNVEIPLARELAAEVPPGVAKVALIVDADDAQIERMLEHVPLDMLQLHGRESERRVRDIRRRTGLPVMKAVGVATSEDLDSVERYAAVADQILVDAKPRSTDRLPGGNGLAFDWKLIAGRTWTTPWMLAGGLTSQNVAEAIRCTGARQVDVSSGVESAPGEKDAAAIARFLKAAA